MVLLDQQTLRARIGAVALGVTEARITLDEGWAPWAQGRLTCSLPGEEDRELLDLRPGILWLDLQLRQDFAKPWALAALTTEYGGSVAALTSAHGGKPIGTFFTKFSKSYNRIRRASTSRRMRLVVHTREFDHKRQRLTVNASSGEQLLLSDALVDTAPWDPGTTSVRTIAGLILARYGMSLQPGDADGTVEAAAALWQPGVTAWDYFAPLAEATGTRLWCDDRGRFWLTEPQPAAAGNLVLSEAQPVTEISDTMSLVDDEWYDAVVVEYKWVDEFDLNRVEFDAAGETSPRNVLRVERTTAYPGPGAAAGILNRAQGRGRQLEVEAVSDYSVEPGQAATITPPGTETQTGYVAAVTWSFPSAEMTVRTRGLVDTPPYSWLSVPPGVSWLDIPPGVKWPDYEPELIGA